LLCGDPGVLRAIDAQRRARVDAQPIAWKLEDMRSCAAVAWDAGDWARAAELLGSISRRASPAAERKRLVIAECRAARTV
jgi:hypothetical protein